MLYADHSKMHYKYVIQNDFILGFNISGTTQKKTAWWLCKVFTHVTKIYINLKIQVYSNNEQNS